MRVTKHAITSANSSKVTRALKTASLGSATQTVLQHRTLSCWLRQAEQGGLIKESMPFRRSSAWINQLQSLCSSTDGSRAQTPIKADKYSSVMNCQRKKVGIRDLPVVKKCFCLKDSSGLPGQSIRPKHMGRMGKQFLE